MSGQVTAQGSRLSQISGILTTQAAAIVVPIFDGKPEDFRGWIKAIEKYIVLAGLERQDGKTTAYQRSTGVVSDFVGRHIQNQGEEPWEYLKAQLKARFGEISDPHHAFALLQKCKQKKGETVALFAERLYGLAEEAFPGEMENEPVQRQLVGFFVDGLADRAVQMKVLRGTPDTFEGAVTIENREATFQKQFVLRVGKKEPTFSRRPDWDLPEPVATKHEPMEVDHARSRACYVCGKTGHRAKHCRLKRVSSIPAAREITCYYCREPGHIKRNCPQRQKRQQQWSN